MNGKEFGEHVNTLAAFKAASESRRLALPQKPEDYQAALPADFKAPEGVKFEFRADDPLLAQARSVMHDIDQGKISGQDAFSKLLGIYAGGQVSSQQRITEARNAEIAKMGPTGPARMDALTTFYEAYLGEGAGKAMASRMFTAADVALHEKIIAKITNGGGASFSTSGREPPEQQGGRVSNEQYAKMTPAERLDYARKFDQTKIQQTRAA